MLLQFLNGLAGASSLFLLASGLSLIFGVTRVVNFAHGSLYMLGMYLAVFLAPRIGFWPALPVTALALAFVGAAAELVVLRRLRHASELLQLLATFALVLLARDFALWTWGPEDMLGPRPPGLSGAFEVGNGRFPEYDAFLCLLGPSVFVALTLVLRRTRWGVLVRAATEDREMTGALGVNERWLFTGVFAVGAALAGLGGATAIPREPASLGVDLAAIADAFVVVVVGGLGSIPGAFLAALVVGEVKAFCIALGLERLVLGVEFIVMAIVLVGRPWGLLGRPPARAVPRRMDDAGFALDGRERLLASVAAALLLLAPLVASEYSMVLLTEIAVLALFAASLHLLLGPGGMVSFGHAAYFGIGAYAAGILLLKGGWPAWAALAAAPAASFAAAMIAGALCARLSDVYLAMLTLALAQIAWSIAYQWDSLTGGSNGLIGLWPKGALADVHAYYSAALALAGGAILFIWRAVGSPFGFALRASRDSQARAETVGIDVRATQWIAFSAAGLFAGLAGGLYAFSKGSISPESLDVTRSVDGLVMVLLGGVQSLLGPPVGAALLTWLQDMLAREVPYWRAAIGATVLALVLLLPQGVAGLVGRRPQ